MKGYLRFVAALALRNAGKAAHSSRNPVLRYAPSDSGIFLYIPCCYLLIHYVCSMPCTPVDCAQIGLACIYDKLSLHYSLLFYHSAGYACTTTT